MSDTPRTDALVEPMRTDFVRESDDAHFWSAVSHARELERECSTLREALQQAERDLQEVKRERAALSHDIDRHVSIASMEAERAEQAERERDEARNKALEDAAMVCEKVHMSVAGIPDGCGNAVSQAVTGTIKVCADAIRALKDTAAMQPEGK